MDNIKNKHLKEWVKKTYPMMDSEDDLLELCYVDMDKFAFWLEKKFNVGVEESKKYEKGILQGFAEEFNYPHNSKTEHIFDEDIESYINNGNID